MLGKKNLLLKRFLVKLKAVERFLLFITLSNILNKFFGFKGLKIKASGQGAGNPPLSLIITAAPLLAASRLVLPNGSFHLEHAP